jgi:hypothetical protein
MKTDPSGLNKKSLDPLAEARLVLVQKPLRIFVAVLRLISIPKREVIHEQVLGTPGATRTPAHGSGGRRSIH